ncbi:MAG: bis(5'-nucleosyl)-tetraphosphatase (symmetrical) [Planctomycetota bacterium]
MIRFAPFRIARSGENYRHVSIASRIRLASFHSSFRFQQDPTFQSSDRFRKPCYLPLRPSTAALEFPIIVNRHIFIGDIQGCRAELEALLKACQFDPANDVLLPVGDLVNRGPDCLGTLRLLRSLNAQAVLGNHDLHLLRVADGSRTLKPSDTFSDILEADDREELLNWLRGQPFVRASDSFLVVHAGIHPQWSDPVSVLKDLNPLDTHPDSDFATRVRTCNEFGERPEEPGSSSNSAYEPWHHFIAPQPGRTIVFGHWAAQGLLDRPGLRGLDTGCVWGNRLTAWIAEENRFVDVPAARVYCEHKNAR